MRLSLIQSSVKARLRHPGWWTAAIALPLVPAMFVLLVPTPHKLQALLEFMLLAVVWTPGLFLCPTPWQWTGDDRPLAGWGRGLLQLLVFSLLLGALMVPLELLFVTGTRAHGGGFLVGLVAGFSIPVLFLMGPAGFVVTRAERLAQEAREAQARAREAQWMSHRGAFSPRLLFSNLHHLADLAEGNARATEQGLVDLAALYRRWLLEAELPLVPLATERSLTDQYLALERGRWGDRLKVRWHLDPELDPQLVPPLLLQPLLERALSAEPSETLELELHESVIPQGLLLRVRVQGSAPAPEEDLLHRLRQRLQTSLGRGAEATLSTFEGGWEALYRLPTPQDIRQDGVQP